MKLAVFLFTTLAWAITPSSWAFQERHQVASFEWISSGERLEKVRLSNFDFGADEVLSPVVQLAGSPDPDSCPNLLRSMSEFSLQVMHDRGVISAEQFEFYRRFADKLAAQQIRFHENLHWVPVADLPSRFPEVKQSELARGRIIGGQPWAGLRRATLYTVAAQILDPESPRGRTPPKWKRVPLALQLENQKWTNEALGIDKDTMAWEWGRAAQLEPALIAPIGRLALFQMAVELIAMGGQIDKAKIFFHSVGKANTDVYRRFYGFEKIDAAEPDDNCVMSARLIDLLERPSTHMERANIKLKEILRITQGRLKVFDAIRLLVRIRTEMNRLVDVRMPRAVDDHAITVSDGSPQFNAVISEFARSFGIENQIPEIGDALHKIAFLHQQHYDFKVEKGPDIFSIYPRRVSIHISGIRADIAAKDPRYLENLVFGLFNFNYRRIKSGNILYTWERSERRPFEFMIPSGVEFDFFSYEPKVIDALAKLGGTIFETLELLRGVETEMGEFSRVETSGTKIRPVRGVHFGAAELGKILGAGYLPPWDEWKFFLNDGYWNTRQLLRLSLSP